MQLILICDVPKLGKNGDVVNVSDGYANNFLLPKKMAKIVDNQSKKELQDAVNAANYHKAVSKQQATAIADLIDSKNITLNLKHGEGGKLYGAVTNKAVSEKINEEYNIEIDKKKISFENEKNIKSPGIYKIKIKLFSDANSNDQNSAVEASMQLVVN